MRGWTVGVHVSCGVWTEEEGGNTEPPWLRGGGVGTGNGGVGGIAWLDVSASIDEAGWLSTCVVNIHEHNYMDVEVIGPPAGTIIHVYVVTGRDVHVGNITGSGEEVEVVQSMWDMIGKYKFPKASLTMLRWKS